MRVRLRAYVCLFAYTRDLTGFAIVYGLCMNSSEAEARGRRELEAGRVDL